MKIFDLSRSENAGTRSPSATCRGYGRHSELRLRFLLARLLTAAGLVLFATTWIPAFASAPNDPYRTAMDKPHDDAPGKVGADLGEQFNMYTGTMEFRQVDLTVPGPERLPIVVSRRLKLGDKKYSRLVNRFADWELEAPHIWASIPPPYDLINTTSNPPVYGNWQTNNCSDGLPKQYTQQFDDGGTVPISSESLSSGFFLVIPGRGDEQILTRDFDGNIATSPGTSRLLTKANWKIDCGNTLKNIQGVTIGESFIATSPNGTVYYFDLLVADNDVSDDDIPGGPVTRWSILATRVTDVFGNSIFYNYDSLARLISISGDDGRQVQIAYSAPDSNYISSSNYIASVSSGGRTWTYGYANHAHVSGLKVLRTLTRPDGSTWSFNMDDAAKPPLVDIYGPQGERPHVFGPFSGSMTTPYGLTAQYTINEINNGVSAIGYTFQPYFDSMALQSKTYSGPGIATATWNFNYVNPPGWSGVVGTPGATTKQLTIRNPDGTSTRITTDNRRGFSEGAVVSEELFDASGQLKRKVDNTYAVGQFYGYSPSTGSLDNSQPGDTSSLSYGSNLVRRNLNIDGTNYVTEWSGFDGFEQPSQMVEYNSGGGQTKTTTISYYTDLNKWLIAKPLQMSVNGIEVMRMNYGSKGEVMSASEFGFTKMWMTYDTKGQLSTVRDALNNTTTLTDYYRGVARKTYKPNGALTQVGVNNFGEMTSMTNPLGATVSIGRDGLGRVTSMSYPGGDTVAWATDYMSYVRLGASELGIPAGSWRGRKTIGNMQESMYFDAELRPVLVESRDTSTGSATYKRMSYDYADRMLFSSYASTDFNVSAGTRLTYDALGRMTQMMRTDGAVLKTVAYLSGNRMQTTDGSGNATITTLQSFGSPGDGSPVLIQAPEGQTTSINRDIFGKILSASQGNFTQRWLYDGYQRLCKKIEPETGQTVMAYDAVGRISWTAKGVAGDSNSCGNTSAPSNAVFMSYDNLSRPVLISYPDSTGNVSMSYDGAGRLLTATNPTAAWSYGYNLRGLMETERVQIDGRSFDIRKNYNSAGSLQSYTYPDGLNIDYSPDAFGRPTRLYARCCNETVVLGTFASGIQYHPNGVVRQYGLGNGLSYSSTLNPRQLPETLQVRNGVGTLFQNLTYSYNIDNDVTSIVDGVDGTDSVGNLTYDGLHRVKSANGLWGSYGYNYDVINNLTARTGSNPLGYNYDAGTNRLASIFFQNGTPSPVVPLPAPVPPRPPKQDPTDPPCPGVQACAPTSVIAGKPTSGERIVAASTSSAGSYAYGYDSQGRTTSDGLRGYVWNEADQLVSIPGIASYGYDAFGKRIKTVHANGGVEYAIYDNGGTLVYVDRPIQEQHWAYVQLAGVPLVEVLNGSPTYLHSDLLGSPTIASYSSGTIKWREHYAPYGEKLNTVNSKIGYTGHAYDSESRLTYAQARFYDSSMGRFLSADPVGYSGATVYSFNRYAYGNNNPYKYTDPTGMSCSSSYDSGSNLFCEQQSLYASDEGGSSRRPNAGSSKIKDNLKKNTKPDGGNYHDYGHRSKLLGSVFLSSPEKAYDGLIEGGTYPGQDGPVIDNSYNYVHSKYFGKKVPIVTLLEPKTFSIFNITLPGHPLDYGFAQRQVVVENFGIYVYTFGIGNNTTPIMKGVNIFLGEYGFTYNDDYVREYLSRHIGQ